MARRVPRDLADSFITYFSLDLADSFCMCCSVACVAALHVLQRCMCYSKSRWTYTEFRVLQRCMCYSKSRWTYTEFRS